MTEYQRYRRNIETMACALVVGALAAYAYGLHVGRSEAGETADATYRMLSPQCQAQVSGSWSDLNARLEAGIEIRK